MKAEIRKAYIETTVYVKVYCDRCRNELLPVFTDGSYPLRCQRSLMIEVTGGPGQLIEVADNPQKSITYTAVFCEQCSRDLLKDYPELIQIDLNTEKDDIIAPPGGNA